MAIYCLCGGENRVYLTMPGEDRIKAVIATTSMPCIRTGADRFVDQDGELYGFYKRHKNVDVFQCLNCKAIIAKE